jgi:hypothetical protein
MTKRLIVVLTLMAMVIGVMAPTALGKPSFDNIDKKAGWACGEAEGLVANHCINPKGKTFNIKVFAPGFSDGTGDLRGPQGSASTDPKFDSRPCPHDQDADPDGTWWNFTGDPDKPLYVCHHSGQQQFLNP